MVFLILTRAGLEHIETWTAPLHLWVNAGVLSAEELADLRRQGTDVSTFTRTIDARDETSISVAAATVRQHHPNDVIWIQYSMNFGVDT